MLPGGYCAAWRQTWRCCKKRGHRPRTQVYPVSRHDISDGGEWPEGGRVHGRTAIVRLSDRVEVDFIEKSFATDSDVLAAARIQPPDAEAFIAVSICPA